MNPKPLSYPGSKCVLHYMEANLRIQLAERIPSIRTANRSTPLRIDYLRIKPYDVTVNDTLYRVGVIRTCDIDWLQETFLYNNSLGGLDSDVNKYGEPDKTYSNEVLPGDIAIDPGFRQEHFELDPENELRRLLIRKGLEHPEHVPAGARVEPENDEEEVVDPFEDVIAPQPDLLDQLHRMQRRWQIQDLRSAEKYQNIVLQKCLREANEISPITNSIQLTVRNGKVKTEDLVYSKKLHEAMKYLMNKIFGKRPGPINVKLFHSFSNHGVLRLPEKFQLRARNLKMDTNIESVMNCLCSIIDRASFPLKSIDLKALWLRADHLQLPFVKNAEKLIISWISGRDTLGVINHIQNKHVQWIPVQLKDDNIITFILNWLEHPRGVGTVFIFKMQTEIDEKLFQMMKMVPDVKVVEANDSGYKPFPHPLTFSIGFISELRVSVRKTKEGKESFWIMKFEEVDRSLSDNIQY